MQHVYVQGSKKKTGTTSNIFKVHNKDTRTTSSASIVTLNIFYTLFYCYNCGF